MRPPRLLIVTPLRVEWLCARRGAAGAEIWRTGMGRARSEAAAARIGRRPEGPVVVLGLGGGLRDGQRAGDVVVADWLDLVPGAAPAAGAGPLPLPAGTGTAAALRAAGLRVTTGGVVSSERLALGGAARAAAGAGGALAVDMESWWLAGAAPPAGFAVVRVLSDAPGQELVSLRTPPALVAAARVLVRAARALSAGLAAVVPTPTEVPS